MQSDVQDNSNIQKQATRSDILKVIISPSVELCILYSVQYSVQGNVHYIIQYSVDYSVVYYLQGVCQRVFLSVYVFSQLLGPLGTGCSTVECTVQCTEQCTVQCTIQCSVQYRCVGCPEACRVEISETERGTEIKARCERYINMTQMWPSQSVLPLNWKYKCHSFKIVLES